MKKAIKILEKRTDISEEEKSKMNQVYYCIYIENINIPFSL